MSMRVMVVDDDPGLPGLLQSLRSLGVTPIGGATRAEGIAIVDSGIDAALVDMQLEPHDMFGGFEILEHLRSKSTVIPAILFTAHVDPFACMRCRQLDVLYVVKPPPSIAGLLDYLSAPRTIHGVAPGDPIANVVNVRKRTHHLTTTEAQILLAAARGANRVTIATELGVSINTIKTHVNHLLDKTGDESLSAAANRVLQEVIEHRRSE